MTNEPTMILWPRSEAPVEVAPEAPVEVAPEAPVEVAPEAD